MISTNNLSTVRTNLIQPDKKLFNSYLMGGFECSTHRNRRGKRLDLIAATRHDEFAEADYERLLNIGMKTARDGVRWHLIEIEPFRYDFASLQKQVSAVQKTGIQIIWDLFHYGYPEDLDIFSDEFIERFAHFSRETVRFLKSEINQPLFVCPVNEISFFSWAAADVGIFYPFEKNRGDELKRRLVQATIAATDEIRARFPDVRFVQTDPAIHVTAARKTRALLRAAESYRQAQFHAFDMLCGRTAPELGGHPRYLDILGLNYYFHNQWRYPSRRKVSRGHPEYRPLHEILHEFAGRYGRPMFIAETGIEDDKRADWFRYVYEQGELTETRGIALEGICLYPIVNHPGWEDNRHCKNGLWCYANESGEREIYSPLAEEISRRTKRAKSAR